MKSEFIDDKPPSPAALQSLKKAKSSAVQQETDQARQDE
jgi:hypothetical protein